MIDEPPLSSVDERIFTLFDVRQLLRNQKKKIIRFLFIGAICGLGFAITRSPHYEVEATFKENKESKVSQKIPLKQLLGFELEEGSGQTTILMQSDQVLKPVVVRLGMQAHVPDEGRIVRLWRLLGNQLRAELGRPIDAIDRFVFQDVIYDGDEDRFFGLRFEDRHHFVVFKGKEEICSGSIGERVDLPEEGIAFTIKAAPQKLKTRHSYPLCISPWIETADGVRQNLAIEPDLNCKSIYELTYHTSDRYLGVEVVNELMAQYRNYLKREHDALVLDQLAYLKQKRDSVYDELSLVFDDYARYLKKNLGEFGAVGLNQRVQSISAAYKTLSGAITSADSELSRLALMEEEGGIGTCSVDTPFSKELQKISCSIQDLKQQRDLVELSLQPSVALNHGNEKCLERIGELRKIREQRSMAKNLMAALDNGSALLPEAADWNEPLVQWASHLDSFREEERGDLTAYLENYLRLLSMQEQVAQERVFYEGEISSELDGISLEMANTLFFEYNRQLDSHNGAIQHFERLLSEIPKSDFALSSLNKILSDSLSQQLIGQASAILMRLKDEKHRSEKEELRWNEELTLQKRILSEHLKQLCEVERLNVHLIREKLSELQKASLSCLNGQISVLRERMGDLISERKTALVQEKEILEKKLNKLRNSFQDFPEQWRLEKWMNFKASAGMKMISSVSELVESMTVGHHMHHVESKILDPALLPSKPIKPRLVAFSFLGACVAGVGALVSLLVPAILQGFPISSEKLRAMRYPFLGEMTPFCDGPEVGEITGPDLELLRKMSLFVDKSPEAKVVALIAGKGPDYSDALGENLGRIGRKSLIIRCDFSAKFQPEDAPGILQKWKGEIDDLPIRKKRGYDLVPTGGFTSYGTEMIRSDAFRNLLEACKKDYDTVFLLFRSPLDSAESVAALSLCEKAVVTATVEPTDLLTPFANWAYHEDKYRLAFIHAPC